MDMYAALPDGSGPHPAVVIAFHVGGLDDFDRKMADQLAEAGFVAVVPDLFHRFSKEVMDGPRLDRLGHLKDADIIADMNAAVDFLTANSAINDDRIGVTGFCMGGRIAWLMAASNQIFKCTVPFYGGNIMGNWGPGDTPFSMSNNINCPMLFHFGAEDGNPSVADRDTFDAELKRLSKDFEFHTYDGAGHAFMDHTNPDRYHEASAAAAWPRTIDFFNNHLK
ncbi:Dienelactone hydrolase family [hydrothermal vent metagenome]|uniref:Dienelactone hydrolase family n=1 Tax=hydrothermal vent metagenome TaxID=652676 RepID=A0A160VDK2_9ZZZZ